MPRKLGRYRLESELASGGMATLYLAHDQTRPGVHRVVAIKLLHPHLVQDQTFRGMFFDEAETLARLRHANVCALLDYELGEHRCYMVLEYISGESFGTVSRAAENSPRPLHQRAALFARMVADACEGLHAAHELGDGDGVPLELVHRDVSPDNLLITHDGQTKIIDFGVATSKVQSHKTNTGIVKGKFAYIQPEVLRGQRADRRADVWGLGVVLWELLTGQRLFRRETEAATLQAVLELPIPAPSALRPELPAVFDAIVLRALERDPERRPATARELGRALTQALAEIGAHVGLADLAEWMDELFPGARARRERLVTSSARSEPEFDATTCHGQSPLPPPASSRPPPSPRRPAQLPRPPPLPRELAKAATWQSAIGVRWRSVQRRVQLGGAAFAALALTAAGWHCVDGAGASAGQTAVAPAASCPTRPPSAGTRDYVLELQAEGSAAPHRVVARVPAELRLESGDPSVAVRLVQPQK